MLTKVRIVAAAAVVAALGFLGFPGEIVGIGAGLVSSAQAAEVRQITVSSLADLNSAIASSANLDTIRVMPGDYGTLDIKGRHPGHKVRIIAADPTKRPQFSQILVSDSSDLTFENLDIVIAADAASHMAALDIKEAQRINIDSFSISDPLANRILQTRGLVVLRGTDISLLNSTMTGVYRGVVVSETNGIGIVHNSFHKVGLDGMDFAACQNVMIDGNFISGIYREPGEHSDNVQFWTAKTTTPSRNITIKNNVFMQGNGGEAQGIFFGNEDSIPYENIIITGNIIVQAMPRGISVQLAKNVTISDNIILSSPGQRWKVAYHLQGLSDSVVKDNLGMAVALQENPSLKLSGNRSISIRSQRFLKDLVGQIERNLDGGHEPLVYGFKITQAQQMAGAPRPSGVPLVRVSE